MRNPDKDTPPMGTMAHTTRAKSAFNIPALVPEFEQGVKKDFDKDAYMKWLDAGHGITTDHDEVK